MSLKQLGKQIQDLVATRTPIIGLVSSEERRLERFLKDLAARVYSRPLPYFAWDCVRGLTGENGPEDGSQELSRAFDMILQKEEPAFYFFKDLKSYLGSQNPVYFRRIKELYQKFSQNRSTAFLLLSSAELPSDLQNEVVVLDVGLPEADEVEETLERVFATRKNAAALQASLSADLKEKFVKAALGLTQEDIERAFLKVTRDRNALNDADVDKIIEEKRQMVAKSGILDFVPIKEGIENLGGMENLKQWLRVRQTIFTREARDFGLALPKGVMVMGISGCGKSLLVKAIAAFWNIPLLRLDMGRIYDGTMGSPEACLRFGIKIAEACAPCVLWIDEIEAGIANQGAKAQGGPPSRVIAAFLTWMQEKTAPVFVGATANEIELVPPEIIRKGRFDEIFYVTLPNSIERAQILSIHLKKRGVNPDKVNMESLTKATEGFNGAEIEQAVISSQFEAFQKKRPVTDEDLYISVGRIVPLATTMKEDIKKLERWAFNRTVKASK